MDGIPQHNDPFPQGTPLPPFPVNSPFMILENDLPACYNLQKKKKLRVVEETVKGEWAKPWDYCMQSKVECTLPRGCIFKPCEEQRKTVQADRNKGEWIALRYKERGCAYSWLEGDCPTRNTSAISSSSTMSSSKRFKKDNVQHIANVVLHQYHQFQQPSNRCPVVSVCAYFHLPETPPLSSSPYSVFNMLTVLRARSAWYCSQC